MKQYSAVVKDKTTHQTTFIENYESESKTQFIKDLRSNGYTVNQNKVKESELFRYIVDHTNMNPWDWKLTTIPQQ